MPQAGSQLLDIDRLADGQADIEFAIALAEFPRLPPQPAGSSEVLRGHAQFRRQSGFAVVELDLAGMVQLTCQRCLQPMRQAVDSEARIALVTAEGDADRVPSEFEPVRAPEGRVRVRDLVEEEVLLALPIVPLHTDLRECAPGAGVEVEDAEPAETLQKPFERLGELLKRKD